MLRLLKLPPRPAPPASEDVREPDPLWALCRAAVRGDTGAEQTLLVALGPALLRAVRGVLGAAHADVEDVLQDAMSAVHGALPGFRGECRTVHFASRVALQTAMNARRRAGYRARYTPSAPPEELAAIARDDRSPADARLATERRDALRRLLDELPYPQAEALGLHVVLGYSVEETARTTGAPRDTVRSRLRAALATLRARVENDRVLYEILGAKP